MTLNHLFDLSFRGRRADVALEFGAQSYTFGDLDRLGSQAAHFLLAAGFLPGDRLCVYLANSPEIILLYLGCVRSGVIFVPINILYKSREIAHILSDAQPRAVVSDTPLDTHLPVWTAAQFASHLAAQPDRPPSVALDGDSPAGIIYTSGTTGISKGAVLTHNNFAVNALNLLACWRIEASDRLLLALPLFHVHGLGNGIHCWLISGLRLRLLERFDHRSASSEFLSFRPTLFFGVPTMYVRLLDLPESDAHRIGAQMRLFVCGSAPLPAHLLENFRSLYGHTILERYGMSETLMNTSNPYEGERRPGSVGLPLPGVSIRLIDGELYLRGPNVFSGYWRRDQATAAAFVDGYFRTGDLAACSPDGYYTLSGRKSDLIISGGFNIYPREIEEFLLAQADVAEAAVVGRPDPLRGEVPIAYIVPSGPFDPVRLQSLCRAQLASFKVPRLFTAVSALPRNALGKIQKHLLPAPSEEPL